MKRQTFRVYEALLSLTAGGWKDLQKWVFQPLTEVHPRSHADVVIL